MYHYETVESNVDVVTWSEPPYEPYQLVGGNSSRGGQGYLHKAFYDDPITQRRQYVAIKELHRKEDEAFLENEAIALSSLEHPAIPKYRKVEESHMGTIFLVCDWIEGLTLPKVRRQVERKLTVSEVLSIALETALGLDYIHKRDVIHRDLSPANVMLDFYGQLKIVDFGCANVGECSPCPTIGHRDFIAPELVAKKHATTAADVYSFGQLVYWLSDFSEKLPGRLYKILDNCLDHDPHKRPTARQLVSRLMPMFSGDRSDCLRELMFEIEPRSVPYSSIHFSAKPHKRKFKSKMLWLLGAGLLTLMLTASVFVTIEVML